ncbi:hypothetical protein HOU00_gp439 [Caulobacter phage CcrPW]|uniref:Uncharacterized protein n=1 Tax=Caulobacter phage CcrPW TaxID=2283271 RepID=A0A385EAC3_9CAUD|nr:hypothetical protein HOU00_gp439 [Caulobacter phage CcrPW]AXQ68686.1 hypothetical protein CcrPW_gp147 [Caulobacter phage CcrPW]
MRLPIPPSLSEDREQGSNLHFALPKYPCTTPPSTLRLMTWRG